MMENSENQCIKVGSLEEEARKRKERLANLKKSLENKNDMKNNEDCVQKPLPKYVMKIKYDVLYLKELLILGQDLKVIFQKMKGLRLNSYLPLNRVTLLLKSRIN